MWINIKQMKVSFVVSLGLKSCVISALFFLSFSIIGCKNEIANENEIGAQSTWSPELDSLTDRVIKLKQEGNNNEALLVLDTLYLKALSQDNKLFMSLADFDRGSLLFVSNQVDSALLCWLNALQLSKQLVEEPNIAQLLSNIGIVYFDKGYLKTAIEYFIQSRKKMESAGDTLSESYLFTTINLAVVHIRQEEYDLAERVLSTVKLGQWPTVDFLYYLNKAIIKSELDDYEQFMYLIDAANSYQDKVNNYYNNVLTQVFLEKSIDNKDLVSLKSILDSSHENLNLNDIDNIINLHYANLLLKPSYTISSVQIDSLIEECSREGLINSRLALYLFLKEYYKLKGNFNRYIYATEKYDFWKKEFSKMNASSNLIDYYSLLEMDNARYENERLKSKNQISDLKIKNQLYLNYFLIFMVSTIILISYLIYLKLQKEKKENEQKLSRLSQNIAVYKETEKDLKETINSQTLRINEVMENVSKIAILRKQLDDFFNKLTDNAEEEVSPKLIKSAKIDLEAFFTNYADLAIIATKDLDSINIEHPIFHNLSSKEKKVLEFIAANYTSREIAVLLSRSEKSVEYTRRNIRKKLDIAPDIGIDDYLSGLDLG